jgi:hypothetical protein
VAVVTLPAGPSPLPKTIVTTVYQVTPKPAPPKVVVVRQVVAPAGGDDEHEGIEEHEGGDD